MELSTTASNFEPIILTLVQAFAIINQLGLMLRTLVLVTAATALRISEILALQWGDIDGENQCIYVRRAYVYGKFGKPKSKASKRPVPLHPVLAAHLLNWRRETPYSKKELVFPSFKLKGRKPRRANMLLSDHLRPAAVKVGVVAPPRAFGFHTFRRTLASVLVANNYDPKLVQERLRHSNIKTTLDIYPSHYLGQAGGAAYVPDRTVEGFVGGGKTCNELRRLANPRFVGILWASANRGIPTNCFEMWWPGTELNRRRRPFQG